MVYLFFQIWVWLLLAFALGWFAHWFFCCRGKDQATAHTASGLSTTVESSTVPDEPATDNASKPVGLSTRPDTVDDLKRIKGIGKVIEQTLNELGIYQFQQIAQWTQENIAWVEDSLSFPGRIDREQWIQQASTLQRGGTTEFANRVDKGDVGYE